jgi:hypothetical protein
MGVIDTKYVVTITAEGKPSVSIECYDPLGAAEAVGRILQTYATIGAPAAPEARPEPPRPEQPSSAPPVCGVHQVAMVGMTGKNGFFWSCHQRQDDGGWCGYKPPKR